MNVLVLSNLLATLFLRWDGSRCPSLRSLQMASTPFQNLEFISLVGLSLVFLYGYLEYEDVEA